MGSSLIPAVKGALVTAFDAATGSDVQVTWSWPRGIKLPDWVLVGHVKGDQEAAAIGRQRRREIFTVEVQVTVSRSDTVLPQQVAERAYEIVAALEDALRADETLGNLSGLISAQVVGTDLTEFRPLDAAGKPTDKRVAEVMVRIRCETRI